MEDNDQILQAMAAAELLMDQILDRSEELMKSKVTLSIGAGLAAAGLARYTLQHPTLIEKAIEQIGASLEIGGQAAGSGMSELATLLGPLIAAGATVGAATLIPGVPPPP